MWKLALAFLIGLCCVHNLAQLPVVGVIAQLAVVGSVAAALTRSGVLAAFLAGLVWAWLNAAGRLAQDLPTALEGRDLLVRGHVVSLPHLGDVDPQFVLEVRDAQSEVPPRIRLTWYKAPQVPRAGELWQLVVRLKRRNGFANPGGFDFEGYQFREGIGASGYVREDTRNVRLGRSGLYTVTRLRAWIGQRIEQAVPSKQMLGVLQGLAIGDTQLMTPQQWRVFAATGTTHLMAISGLHISMVAALAAWLGGAIVRLRFAQARGWVAMHGQVVAGSIAAVVYSVLAGLSVPTQRTALMLCVYFASRWWRRELHIGRSLALALIAILFADPFAALAAGPWLSFGAVAAIALALSGRLRAPGTIGGFARVQAAVTIGLVPVLLAAFGGLSLVSPLANVLAVPLFTLVIVPAVLLGTLVAAINLPAGGWILSLTVAVLERTWPILEWLTNQPLAFWHVPRPELPAFVALLAGVLLLVLPGIWPTRVAGALLCLPVVLNHPPGPARGDFELAVLDVGQGLAVVVRTQAHALLYDAGPRFGSGRDAAELAVLPYLRFRGIRRLDALVISHGDLDHAGGMNSVTQAMPVARLLLGPTVRSATPESQCRQGQHWSWDGVEFDMLHPGEGVHEHENDSSCVLRVSASAGSALLAGDVEGAAEEKLVRGGLRPADVVIVPHHGSSTSSTTQFVAALGPAYALTSAGYLNRWGFPKGEVLERWQRGGACTLTTSDSGAIEVAFQAGRPLRVIEYRRAQRRYWQRRGIGPSRRYGECRPAD